jgi:hypothetical protein
VARERPMGSCKSGANYGSKQSGNYDGKFHSLFKRGESWEEEKERSEKARKDEPGSARGARRGRQDTRSLLSPVT